MHFIMLLVLTIGEQGAQNVPAHHSQPAHLRVIVNVRSTNFCTAMHTMVLPLGYITRVNEDNIETLAVGASNLSKNQSIIKSNISVREISYDTAQNLTLADRVMNESWRRFPRGTAQSIDGLRQRLQNIIDLQRALVNKYMQVGEGYEGCIGSAENLCSSLRGDKTGTSAWRGYFEMLAAVNAIADPEGVAVASAHDIAHFARPSQIGAQLDLQEAAFVQEITAAGRTCGI